MNLNIACCQIAPTTDLQSNLKKTENMISLSANKGADFVILPELFLFEYGQKEISRSAEPDEGYMYEYLRNIAKENGIYLFAGSIPERDKRKVYNTSYAFDRNGNCIGKYRKIHLFNIDLPGKLKYNESKIFTPGDEICVVDTEFGKVGIAICFDLRFVEQFRLMVNKGAELIVVPAAFSYTTGEKHWDTLLKSRAIDNQCFIAACGTGYNPNAPYPTWGHSAIINPWGDIIGSIGSDSSILFTTIELDETEQIRQSLPILSSLRNDIYECIVKGNENE